MRSRQNPSASTPPGAPSNADAFTVLGLLLLAVVPYLNSVWGSFVYDDRLQVLENPYVHSFRYLGKIFGTTVWTFEGAQGVSNYYRPLMTFAYLVCYKLFGPIPFGFHLFNLMLHAAVVVLLFAVTEQLFGDRLISLVVAGLFALHPIHTESVAWIAAVTDLELTLFFLLTFFFYLRLARPATEYSELRAAPSASEAKSVSESDSAVAAPSRIAADSVSDAPSINAGDRPGGVPWKTPAAMLASYVLALLSKEQALVLPALATIYEHAYRGDRLATSLRTKIARYAGLWIAAAIYIAFRIFVLGGFAPAIARPALSWTRVLLTAVALTGSYVWKLLWPAHLSAFYVFHESDRFSDTAVLGGLLALIACLNLFVWLWSRARPLSFALVWMGITLAPVLNARWMPAGVFADRYLYLPSVGFCWLVGCAAVWLWRASPTETSAARTTAGSRTSTTTPQRAATHVTAKLASATRAQMPFLRRAVPVVLAAVALLYGVRTIRRNRDWRTEEVLFRCTLEEQPDAQLIRTDLGVVYWERGDEASAEREWTAALGPGHPYAPTLNNLGLIRSHQKRYTEAIALFQQAMALRPKYMDPYKNLASTYAETGRIDDADREFRQAVALDPLSSDARNTYGHFLLDRGRLAEAEEQFRLSAEADPNAEAAENLGQVLAGQGDTQRARVAFEAALALDPFDSRARFALAALDEQDQRYTEAMREYRAGLETDPQNASALEAVRRLQAQGAR
jgi:protein O-mannosyl-transferase